MAILRADHGFESTGIGNLMLFSPEARFRIEASAGVGNYFVSGCHVRPVSDGLFVAASGGHGSPGGLRMFWQFIKQVYIPI